MQMNKKDYLTKALLDTQERVRDYMNYAKQVDDPRLQATFSDFAEKEGQHARILQDFLNEL